MQLPSNMILTRVRPSLYLPFWVCIWSCISASTAATTSYQSLIAVRFFLGIAEAPFFPGAFYLLSCWYTKKELALRTAVLYSGLVLATAFSGLLAAGVFAGLDDARGISGWRWLFIIEGAASFLAGLVAFILLPDFPVSVTGSASWLFTAEERQVAIERIERDRVSDQESDHSIWYGLKLAGKDFRVWVFVSQPTKWPPDELIAKNSNPSGIHTVQQPHCLRIQQFLSHHRQRLRPRLQYRHPPPNCAALPRRRPYLLRRRLLQRPQQRARLPHRGPHGRRDARFHHFRSNTERVRALRRLLPLHLRVFRRKLARVYVGCVGAQSDAREASLCDGHHQHYGAVRKYLESVLLLAWRFAEISHGYVSDDGVLSYECCRLRGYEIHAQGGQ